MRKKFLKPLSLLLTLFLIVSSFSMTGFNTSSVVYADSLLETPILSSKGYSLTPSKEMIEIFKNETFALNIIDRSGRSGSTITWSTSDANIISVSNGSIKGLNPGSATVYATIKYPIVTSQGTEYGFAYLQTNVTVNKSTVEIINAPDYITQDNYTFLSKCNSNDQTITWSSADENIIAIGAQSGVAKGVSTGRTTITATASDGSSSSVLIEVRKYLERIKLNASKTKLTAIGDTATISATLEPNDAVTPEIAWATSDANAVTVDQNGVVTAQNVATRKNVTITAYSKANPNINASISIEVDIPVSSMTISDTNITINKGETRNLLVTVLPFNITSGSVSSGVSFTSSSNETVTVDSVTGKIKGVKAGTAIITATYNSKSVSCTVNVKPSKTTLSVNRTSTKEATVKIKQSDDAKVTAYRVEYSTKENFSSNVKKIVVPMTDNLKLTLKKLKAKDYYIRVVTIAEDNNGVKTYSDYSKVYKMKNYIITPSVSNVVLNQGKNKSFTVKLNGKKTNISKFKITSSNNKVAAVKNGKIIAKGGGKCTVTISYKNFKKTINVRVKAKKNNKNKNKK